MNITHTGLGIDITASYTTDLGNIKNVTVTVSHDYKTLNVAATGSLNSNGIAALCDAMSMAKIIMRRGIAL